MSNHFHEQSRMLMRQNANNDICKDPPIVWLLAGSESMLKGFSHHGMEHLWRRINLPSDYKKN